MRSWLLTAAMATCVAVCGPFTAPASAQGKLEVSQYGRVISSLPWAIAYEKGWLRENGLAVEGIIAGDGGGTSLRNLLASPLPFGEVGTTVVVSAALRTKLDLRIVYLGSNHLGDVTWISTPNSGIRSIEDLRGKRVAYSSPKSISEMILRLVLDAKGVRPAELVSTGGMSAGMTALNQGAVDAMFQVEPFLTKNAAKYNVVFVAADHVPKISWAIGVTTREFAEKHPDTVRALIDARRRAVELIYRDPEEAAKIYAKVWEADMGLARQMVAKFSKVHYWAAGEFDAEGMSVMMTGMQKVGELDRPFDISKLIDTSYLKRAP